MTKPSFTEMKLAAQIRVSVDKRLGEPTPQWIIDLASKGKAHE